MKNANRTTILDDLKFSFKFATKNVISYVLAIFGVLIVSAILLVVVAAMIFIPLFFVIGGFENLVTYFDSFSGTITDIEITNLALGSIMFALPFLAPLFVAIGALFGIGREIVESEGTNAEGVFVWYKKKFVSLVGGGIILFIVVLGPLLLALLVGTAIYGGGFLNLALLSTGSASTLNPIIVSLLLIWFAISTGLLSMLFPSIIDGYSVFESTKKSIRMSIRYFDRIFGVWMSFLLILGALLVPFFATPFIIGITGPVFSAMAGILMIYGIPALLILIFLFLPAVTIGLTRVYMILTADDADYEHTPEEEESGPSFIGGA